MRSKKLRIVYLAGPGDAPAVLRSLAQGKVFRDVAHVPYSGMVFNACRELDADLLSISTNDRADDFSFGRIRALNVADPLKGKSGAAYHFGNYEYAKLVRDYAKEFDANLVLTGPQPYPFLQEKLMGSGIKMVIALHALLLPEFKPASLGSRIAVRLNRRFYSHTCEAILTHPGSTVRQVLELTRGHSKPIVEFLPLLRADAFPGVTPPEPSSEVFRVMTVGRVEEDKGIFSLLETARLVRDQVGNAVRFDVCGAGSALEEARRRVLQMNLQDTVTLHGWTKMEEMTRLWSESHVAVVPTTSSFVEGFNQVVIEAALAGRPIITSRVCPALEYVRPCAIEVGVDNAHEYAQAVVQLANDRNAYKGLQLGTSRVVKPFLDADASFETAVRYVLSCIADGRQIASVRHPPELSPQ